MGWGKYGCFCVLSDGLCMLNEWMINGDDTSCVFRGCRLSVTTCFKHWSKRIRPSSNEGSGGDVLRVNVRMISVSRCSLCVCWCVAGCCFYLLCCLSMSYLFLSVTVCHVVWLRFFPPILCWRCIVCSNRCEGIKETVLSATAFF